MASGEVLAIRCHLPIDISFPNKFGFLTLWVGFNLVLLFNDIAKSKIDNTRKIKGLYY